MLRSSLVALATLVLCSCHVLLPLGGANPERQDLARPVELGLDRGHETGQEDGSPGDIAAEDAGPPACVEPPEINVTGSCTTQCPVSLDDLDGDCLEGLLDPWPATCNGIQMAQEFATQGIPPGDWALSGCSPAAATWGCGHVRINSTSPGCSLNRSLPVPIPPSSTFIVQARVDLLGNPQPGDWFGLNVTIETGVVYTCKVELAPQKLSIHPAGMSVFLLSSTTHVLEMYTVGGRMWCRDLGLWSVSVSLQGPVTGSVTVGLITNTVDLEVDYLRVFEAP